MRPFPIAGGSRRSTATRLLTLLGLAGVLLAAETGPAASDQTVTITVTASSPEEEAPPIALDDLSTVRRGDGAEALRGIAGLALSRMGGHGLEPVLRGQQQGRLQILHDGAEVHGGCPNRMDPSTAYAGLERFDQVTVQAGVTTLAGLLPSPAGRVAFERAAAEPGLHGRAALRAGGNGPLRAAAAELARGAATGQARLGVDWEDAGNYRDGAGREVRSAYRSRGASGDLALRSGGVEASLSASWTSIDEALFAGAGMDSPDSDLWRVGTEGRWTHDPEGVLRGGHWQLAHADVDHLMDNYSLRVLSGPLAMRVPTTSETTTASTDLVLGLHPEGSLRLGLAGRRIGRDATRYAGPDPSAVDALHSLLWPEVQETTLGAFAEYDQALGAQLDLRLGLRVDRVEAEADAAERDPPPITPMLDPPSPAALYRQYYGSTDSDAEDTLWAALLRLRGTLPASGLSGQLALSHLARSPDATERHLAAWAPMPAMRWIGDPGLDPERHRQLELELAWSRLPWRVELRGFYDDVADWIMRDTAQGQDGVLRSDGASIYRNIEATLWGGELAVDWQWERLRLAARVGSVRGENDSDGTPLPQMPPLGGRLSAGWQASDWGVGVDCDWAARQDRIDPGSGLDLAETSAWVVLGVHADCRLDHGLELSAGVDNVFDRAYARHLNRASAFDPDLARVNEPGLQAWVAGAWTF